MARFYYYVVKSGAKWETKYTGQTTTYSYDTQAAAMTHAVGAAKSYHEKTGKPSGVRVQGRDNLWQDERSYGNDPFPPPG
jgi:hypothetical protein